MYSPTLNRIIRLPQHCTYTKLFKKVTRRKTQHEHSSCRAIDTVLNLLNKRRQANNSRNYGQRQSKENVQNVFIIVHPVVVLNDNECGQFLCHIEMHKPLCGMSEQTQVQKWRHHKGRY
jgi:hypothetical protein